MSRRREELLTIAADLFAEHGYANVTVDDIGEGRQDQLQGDEGQVRHHQARTERQIASAYPADIRAVEYLHAVIGLQAPGKLAVSHICRDNTRRTPLEQHLREPTGRCPRVQA